MESKKFDLVKALQEKGFIKTDYEGSAYMGDLFVKDYEKTVEVAWYGMMTSQMKVTVRISPDKSICQVTYFNGNRKPFKNKVHLCDKKAFNAIKATVENNGYTF